MRWFLGARSYVEHISSIKIHVNLVQIVDDVHFS